MSLDGGLISVIVPVYNTQAYLDACLLSIANQTYKNIEVLLVDDESTDGSPTICEQWCQTDSRFKALRIHHGGLSRARNAGIEASKGEWLTFVDSDDELHPQFLETLHSIIGEDSVARCKRLKAEQCDWGKEEASHVVRLEPKEAIERVLYQNASNAISANLMRRELLAETQFAPGILYEDLDIIYRLFDKAQGKIVATDKKLYFYRQRAGSLLHVYDERRWDALEVAERITHYYKDDERMRKAANHRRFSAYFNLYGLASSNGERSKAKDRCWETIKSLRWEILTNPHSRMKNRAGALLAYFGEPLAAMITKLAYKS